MQARKDSIKPAGASIKTQHGDEAPGVRGVVLT
jgi:hypothetical protein